MRARSAGAPQVRLSGTDRMRPPCATASFICLPCRCCVLRFCWPWCRLGRPPWTTRKTGPTPPTAPAFSRQFWKRLPPQQRFAMQGHGALPTCFLKNRNGHSPLGLRYASMFHAAACWPLPPLPALFAVRMRCCVRRRRCPASEAGWVALIRSFVGRCGAPSFIRAALRGTTPWNFSLTLTSGSPLRC